jgi:hypothetical protein
MNGDTHHEYAKIQEKALAYFQPWRLKSETQTVRWVFIASSPRLVVKTLSRDPIPSIIPDTASPHPRRRSWRTTLASLRGAGAAFVVGTWGERRSRGGAEKSSSSWSHRRSAYDVGTPPSPSPSTPALSLVQEEKELRRGEGVELKLEPPPLCLWCQRPTTPIPLRASATAGTGGEGAEEPSSNWSRSAFDAGTPPPPSPSMLAAGALRQWGMRKVGPHTIFAGYVRLLHIWITVETSSNFQ